MSFEPPVAAALLRGVSDPKGMTMTDYNFGRLSKRQLTIRPIVPFAFERWDGDTYRFSWRCVLNPLRWIRAARDRWGYRFWYSYMPGGNHRCYCLTEGGRMFDLSIVVGGLGFVLFYSHFGGEVPCPCDEALSEIRGEDVDE